METGKHHFPERSAVFVWCKQRAGLVWFFHVFLSGEGFDPNNFWLLACRPTAENISDLLRCVYIFVDFLRTCLFVYFCFVLAFLSM